MSAPQHTPGPWTVEGNVEKPSVWSSDGSICYTTRNNSQANARLIAAAPDLLAACKELLRYHIECEGDRVAERARTALAKATGDKR